MATCPDGHQSVATDYCDECGLSMSGQVQMPTGGSAAAGGSPASGSGSGYGAAGDPCPRCLLPRQAGDTFCEGCGFNFDEESTDGTVDSEIDIEAEIAKAEKLQREADEQARRQAEEEARRQAAAAAAQQNQPDPLPDPDSNPLRQPVPADPPASGGAAAPTEVQWIAIASADRAYYDSVVAEGEIDPNAYPFPPFCPDRQFELKGDTVRIGRSGKKGDVEIDLTGPPKDPGISHLHAVLQQRPDGGWAVVDLESMNGTVLNDDTAPIPPNQAFPVEAGHRIHVGVWTTLTLIQLS